MYQDDELVMLSALQHYQFCPRQCALIHLEEQWDENYLTASGRILHESVDSGRRETRVDLHAATSLRLVSHRLGIMGIADLVEFHKVNDPRDGTGTNVATRLPNKNGWWKPFPVEYKHGKPKEHRADEVQLCAQAICLEEMMGVSIRTGALFYGTPRRRTEVLFDDELRNLTERTAQKIHELFQSGSMPSPGWTKCCNACSLADVCCPKILNGKKSARQWIQSVLEENV